MIQPGDQRHESESVDSTLVPVIQLLALRSARLASRPGLCDRVNAAVAHELDAPDAPVVLARLAPMRWHRSMAAAAAVVLGCGILASVVLRSDPVESGTTVRAPMLAVADGSNAERMLVALLTASAAEPSRERAVIAEEVLPCGRVQFDDLDLELRTIIGESSRSAEGGA